jgi:branched-chain amino acid transport system substrate-binding protein
MVRTAEPSDDGAVMSVRASRQRSSAILSALLLVLAACASTATPGEALVVGAVFPLEGNAAGLAGEELAGVQAAARFVNADGGIGGRQIVLDVRDLERASDAPAVMRDLRARGVTTVIGAYSSALSIAASQAAAETGLVYWEAGAVADRLTGRGLPGVFRVGASGANLGAASARFAVGELAARLDRTVDRLRVAIVAARDDYAESVAAAAASVTTTAGSPIVANTTYDMVLPDWPGIMTELAAADPDVIILASHIPDGIAFRRAMLDAGLRVGALIGSTMAECDPDFAGELGSDAVGIFASDRPTGGFQPNALDPAARQLYDRFAATWVASDSGGDSNAGDPYDAGGYSGYGSGASDYTISGPVEEGSAAAGPSEEGLSGFTAAWALFHDVLPAAAESGSMDAAGITAAALAADLPMGALPNGAGLRFSDDPGTLGQNTRAAAVIWQWQAVRSYTFVWPSTYQTGEIAFVPLAR